MSRRLEKPPIDNRLLDVAIDQFGRFGFEAASTRAIATAAETAMSSITYHYGGKEGLYLAAAQRIATQVGERMQAAIKASQAVAVETPGPDGAIPAILVVIDGFVMLMTSPQSAPWARFVVREQMAPSPAFDILYSEMMEGIADHVSGLIRVTAAGRIDDADARVKALAIFGQVLVFRVARATVLRVMGWDDVTPAEAEEIQRTVRAHTLAILESIRGDRI